MNIYRITIKRNIDNESITEIQTAGVVQGMAYALCSLPFGTHLFDIEMFKEMFIMYVVCDELAFSNFVSAVNTVFPSLCEYRNLGVYKEWSGCDVV